MELFMIAPLKALPTIKKGDEEGSKNGQHCKADADYSVLIIKARLRFTSFKGSEGSGGVCATGWPLLP